MTGELEEMIKGTMVSLLVDGRILRGPYLGRLSDETWIIGSAHVNMSKVSVFFMDHPQVSAAEEVLYV